MSQLMSLALDVLFIPPWNPRKYINPVELAELAAYLQNGGLVPRILVYKENDSRFLVISGQRRVAAHRQLGRTHIEAEVLEITLHQAKIMAKKTNEGVKPIWLDDYEWIEVMLDEDPTLSQRALADELKQSKTVLNQTVLLMKLLNPASRDLIRQSLSSQKPLFFDASVRTPDTSGEKSGEKWQLTEYVALALNPLLNDRPQAEAQTLAEEALKVILARQLTGPQVSQLVKWVQAGHPAETFDHKAAKPASKAKSPKPTAYTAPHADSPSESAQPKHVPQHVASAQVPEAESVSATPAQPVHSANHAPHPAASQQATHSAPSSGSEMGSAETAIYEAIAGISVIAKIKAKIKKGERPNFFEVLLLAGHQLWNILAWLGKHAFKLAKPVGKFVWKIVKDSLKGLLKALGRTVYNVVRVVMGLAVLALLGWFAWELLQNGFHPRAALMEMGKILWEWAVLLWRAG